MSVEFDTFEKENGIFLLPSLETVSHSNLIEETNIKGVLESVFYMGLLVGYT